MKRRVILTLLGISLSPLHSQTNSKDKYIVNEIEKEFELSLTKSHVDSSIYSFFQALDEDNLINNRDKIEVKYFTFFRKNLNRDRKYDYSLEIWHIKDSLEANKIHELLGEVLYDSFYEKPPKSVLVKNNSAFIISTWGAVNRNYIYKMRDHLIKKFKMVKL